MPKWAMLFQLLISLDLASHYMHMYATLSMGESGQSHKQVDSKRSWLLHLYYTNKVCLDTAGMTGNSSWLEVDCFIHTLCNEWTLLCRTISSCFHWGREPCIWRSNGDNHPEWAMVCRRYGDCSVSNFVTSRFLGYWHVFLPPAPTRSKAQYPQHLSGFLCSQCWSSSTSTSSNWSSQVNGLRKVIPQSVPGSQSLDKWASMGISFHSTCPLRLLENKLDSLSLKSEQTRWEKQALSLALSEYLKQPQRLLKHHQVPLQKAQYLQRGLCYGGLCREAYSCGYA